MRKYSQPLQRMRALALAIVFAVAPAAAHASIPGGDDEAALLNLSQVYAVRPDLQLAFPETIIDPATGLPYGLDVWARKYGAKEHPDALAWYDPANHPPQLALASAALAPHLRAKHAPLPAVSASAIFVVDDASRSVLASRNARRVWPLASITKLMTATVVLDRNVPMSRVMSMSSVDEVGGARIAARSGEKYDVASLFGAMIVGSANNAANALARSTKLARKDFIAAMNAKAKSFGLASTRFYDPSGIELENVSTAEEIAALGFEAFSRPQIRRAATTAQYRIRLAKKSHTINNTNTLLTDQKNGLIVMGGKTGYLIESKWNLVVRLRGEHGEKPLMIVVLGSDNRAKSFSDAEAIARWAWRNYEWGS